MGSVGNLKLAGKKALVTGGTSGIGLATASLFLKEGATVAITGICENELMAAAKVLGSEVLQLVVDVRFVSQIEAAMEKVKEALGTLDVLFINAGICPAMTALEMVTEENFDNVMNVNFKGAFFTLQKASPLLASGASVVFNASICHELAVETIFPYGPSKAAVRSLTITASAHLTSRDIRVNSVSPGPTATDMVKFGAVSEEEVAAMHKSKAALVPMKRIAKPEEIAAAVLFLGCADSSFMTGQDIVVDGGWLAHPVRGQ